MKVKVFSTNAILGALPPNRAGVGSAATDTAQETGNALGVAVLGSILTAAYHTTMDATPAIQALPASLRAIARDSIGSATALAAHLPGPVARLVVTAAQTAFVQAIGPTVLIGAGISCCGCLIELVFLPHRITVQSFTEGFAGEDGEKTTER